MFVPSLLVQLLALLNPGGLCKAFQPKVNQTSLERRQCVYNPATDRFDICNRKCFL